MSRPEPALAVAPGQIGPNAVLQLVPVLDAVLGPDERARLMGRAGLGGLPADTGLMAEAPAARLHQALRRAHPDRARQIAAEAGRRTADYILAHRIPKPAQAVLRALPAALAGPILARAIAKHAWTFAGSGRFSVRSTRPLVFEIAANPITRAEHAKTPVCHWHAAVFERLFTTLVDPSLRCRETACCAAGAPACRFELTR